MSSAMEHLDRDTVQEIIDLAERCYAGDRGWHGTEEITEEMILSGLTRKERLALIDRLEALSTPELDELQALMWLGREGGTAEDWGGWLRHAQAYRRGAALYVAGKAPLADYLRAGLRTLDRGER